MIKGHTDIDIWNTGFFINADYFSDDFIIYNNTGKDLTRKTLAHPFFHNNSYKQPILHLYCAFPELLK